MNQPAQSLPAMRYAGLALLIAIGLAGCTRVGMQRGPSTPPPPGTAHVTIDLPVTAKSDCKGDVGVGRGLVNMSDAPFHNLPQTRIPPVATSNALQLPTPGSVEVTAALTVYSQARNMIAASAAIYAGSQSNGKIMTYTHVCHHNITIPLPGPAFAQILNVAPFSKCPSSADQCLQIPLPDWNTVPPATGLGRYTQADQALSLSEQAFFVALP